MDYKNYGIEVKSTDAIAKTAKRLLEDGKLNYLYLLKEKIVRNPQIKEVISAVLFNL